VTKTLGAPRGATISLLVFSLFSNLLMLTGPLYMLQIFDRVLSSHSIETLWLLTIIALGALLTAAFLETIRTRLLQRLANRIYGQWGQPLLRTGSPATGFARLTDLGEVRGFLSGGGILPVLDAPWIPLYLFILFLFHPLFGWVAIAGGLIIVALVVLSEMRMRAQIAESQSRQGRALTLADRIIKDADTVRALGMMEPLGRQWEHKAFDGMRSSHAVASRIAADNSAAKFIRMAVQISVLGSAAYLVTVGELTAGVMIAGSILITRALGPLEAAISGWRNMVSAYQAYRRTRSAIEAMNEPPKRQIERPQGRLALERVTAVADRKTLLNNLSLTVEPGEMLAITGPSGAGKSILARTMLGLLQPTLGKVLIDDLDLASWNFTELGRYLGYVGQDAPLFPGTIGENIARMDPEATHESITEAAKRAHCHDLILKLPDGYETMVADGSNRLPQGHRQRIVLARALYGDPRLVVLDEPETHLDPAGEQALLATLSGLKQAAITTVIVTHRPEVLAGATRILVLKEGSIQKLAAPAEVLPANTRGPNSTQKPQPAPPASSGKASTAVPAGTRPKASGTTPRAPAKTAANKGQTRQPAAPSAKLVGNNRAQAEAGTLTLRHLLHPRSGAIGEWLVRRHGKVGTRYLRSVERRLEALLDTPLDQLSAETLTGLRDGREHEASAQHATLIERAMQRRHDGNDARLVRECLTHAVSWRILNAHPLVASQPPDKRRDGSKSRANGGA